MGAQRGEFQAGKCAYLCCDMFSLSGGNSATGFQPPAGFTGDINYDEVGGGLVYLCEVSCESGAVAFIDVTALNPHSNSLCAFFF